MTTKPVQIMQNLWPGLSPATAQEFSRIGQGLPILNVNKFYQEHSRFYAVQDYGTAGHTSLTFFANQQAQDGVCNLGQGEISIENPFWLTGICITFQDLTAAGARSGAQADAAAAGTPLTRFEQIRTILQAGLLKLQIAGRPVFERQDLTGFPQDGGYVASTALNTFAAATNSSLVACTNGVPLAGNRFQFTKPLAVLPQKRVRVDCLWQSALSITTAGRLKVELVGETLKPLNQ